MRAVDTNVLIRLLIRDDPRQAASAEAFIDGGAWVSVLALVETVWVLSTVYQKDPTDIARTVEMLLNHESLSIQDSDAVVKALQLLTARPALGFSDCLMLELARKAGHLPLGTFDRRLARVDGAQRL